MAAATTREDKEKEWKISSLDTPSPFEGFSLPAYDDFESTILNDASVAIQMCQSRSDKQTDKLAMIHELELAKDGYLAGSAALRQLGIIVPALPAGDLADYGKKIVKNVRKTTQKVQETFSRTILKVYAGEKIAKGAQTMQLTVIGDAKNKYVQSEFKKIEKQQSGQTNNRSRNYYKNSSRDRSRSRNRRFNNRDRSFDRQRDRSPRRAPRCNFCQKKGHMIKDCWERRDQDRDRKNR